MNIFFDLDGTILDSRERLYRLFQHLVSSSQMNFDEYWAFKRNKIGHRQILVNEFRLSLEEINLFEQKWMSLIEAPQWLSYDKPFAGAVDFLVQLKNAGCKLFVVTARQFNQIAEKQIEENGLSSIFEQILVTNQTIDKITLIELSGVTLTSQDWIVGDTGKDIETGKMLGLKTAAVLSGFLNRKSLMEYKPDVIVDKITDLNFEQLNEL